MFQPLEKYVKIHTDGCHIITVVKYLLEQDLQILKRSMNGINSLCKAGKHQIKATFFTMIYYFLQATFRLSPKISDRLTSPHFGQVVLSHSGNLLLTGTLGTIFPAYHNFIPSARPKHFRGGHLTMDSNGKATKVGM